MSLRIALRNHIAAHPALWRRYRSLRNRLLNEHPAPGPIHQVLREAASEAGPLSFVQVGSNDAGFGDPIIDFVLSYGWRGLLVEPVPYVFERLKARHGANPRLTLDNVAVADTDGPRTFYSLEPLAQPLSAWYDQLGSFSREHILRHERFTPGLEAHIRETQVPCLTLASLLRKHGITRMDLLHIDAEGYDFVVLRSLDFAAVRPSMILFEHGHLPRAERAACASFLEQEGYRLLVEGRDTLALRQPPPAGWPKAARLFDSLAPETG